jgi:hypothetical protein
MKINHNNKEIANLNQKFGEKAVTIEAIMLKVTRKEK